MNKIIFVIPLVILALLPILNGVSTGAQWAFAHKEHHHGNSNTCDNSAGTCGNTSSDTAYEIGLDDGTKMAQQGSAQPTYDDCVQDGGIQLTWGNNAGAYCNGLTDGYNDTINSLNGGIP